MNTRDGSHLAAVQKRFSSKPEETPQPGAGDGMGREGLLRTRRGPSGLLLVAVSLGKRTGTDHGTFPNSPVGGSHLSGDKFGSGEVRRNNFKS